MQFSARNAAYYRAFVTGNFAAMSRIWADEQESCVHPGWPVLVGRKAVLESWRRILGNPGAERIEFHDAAAMVAGSEGRVLCIEVIGGMAFAASNWFPAHRRHVANDPPPCQPYRPEGRR
jgi:hypothetical protein